MLSTLLEIEVCGVARIELPLAITVEDICKTHNPLAILRLRVRQANEEIRVRD